eukprot:2424609-Rhodomonas_salina.4
MGGGGGASTKNKRRRRRRASVLSVALSDGIAKLTQLTANAGNASPGHRIAKTQDYVGLLPSPMFPARSTPFDSGPQADPGGTVIGVSSTDRRRTEADR